nr:hypothetical protein [Tanacetum cinerariifolium]
DDGGNGGVGATAYLAIRASMDAAIGGGSLTDIPALQSIGDLGGVGADSSVSNIFVSLAEETWSTTDMPLQKRARFTALAFRFKVGKSSAVAAARQPILDVAIIDATPRRLVSKEVGYGIEVVLDDIVRDMNERASTTTVGLSKRVTDLSITLSRDTYEIHVRLEDAQDDRALQRARVNTLFRDR